MCCAVMKADEISTSELITIIIFMNIIKRSFDVFRGFGEFDGFVGGDVEWEAELVKPVG